MFQYKEYVQMYLMRQQSQKQSKTLSTTQSVHQVFSIPVHSYHRYDSLLRYIVSFITDFKFHIVQLKQLIYDLVGLDMTRISNWDPLHYESQCEHCQVQFMIDSCKKARNDIVRLISIMRGFSKSQKYIPTHPQKCFLKKQTIPQAKNYYPSFNPQPDNYYQSNELYSSQVSGLNSHLIMDDVGFLTFREIQARSKSNSTIRNQEHMRIIQENVQTSRTHRENTKKMDNHQQITNMHNGYQNEAELNQCSLIFKRAIQLINLIRVETNKFHINQETDNHITQHRNNLLANQTLPKFTSVHWRKN